MLRPGNGAPAPGETLSLLVVATNRGVGRAKDAVVTLPFDAERARIVGASFSRESAWVSAVTSSTLELRTGPLAGASDTVTLTLRLAIPADAPAGGDLVGRLSFSWSDAQDGGEGNSNKADLAVGGSPFSPVTVLERTASSGADGSTFSSAIFAPGEPVAIWYQPAIGAAVAVKTLVADAEGRISLIYDTSGLPAGAYTMVAYGAWTELTAIAPFTTR